MPPPFAPAGRLAEAGALFPALPGSGGHPRRHGDVVIRLG
jgi:hypothetical protein